MKPFPVATALRGERAGPALLLVHALGTDGRFWDEAVADLERDHFCIVPDLRASGRMPNPPRPVTAQEHARDLLAVLDTLDVGTALFAGCAIGGMVASIAAAMEPERCSGLIMTNPGLRNADPVKTMLGARVEQVRAHGMAALLPGAAERAFHGMAKDARFETYLERYAAQDPEAYALTVLGFLDIDIAGTLPSVRCPTLLMPGGNDVLMPSDSTVAIRALVPHAEVVPLPDVAHFIPFQSPQRFVAELRRFEAATARSNG